ncbi:hypothetical protein [Mannheimia haemolytica]|uniref:hypothetical protein n=1 Tax=Mannheimia haemolytica TaxID=75985 RepID=UPI001EFF1C06|nr:hypothetical protein [Mannheimia haemolytica]ULX33690.1 hypothetical protein H1D05_08825 [Mannheimia haemolytica]
MLYWQLPMDSYYQAGLSVNLLRRRNQDGINNRLMDHCFYRLCTGFWANSLLKEQDERLKQLKK